METHTLFVFSEIQRILMHTCRITKIKNYISTLTLIFLLTVIRLRSKVKFDINDYTYMKKSSAQEMFVIHNQTINWIFKKLAGFTIATEPEFCGRLKKSSKTYILLYHYFIRSSKVKERSGNPKSLKH